jgi:hypothetical protein
MDLSPDLPRDHPLRLGADLVLCHGTRHVRVLSLPDACGKNALLGEWEDSFGDEVVLIWPPLLALPGVHHTKPSTN